MLERPRLSRIYYNGKFFSYPLKAFEALFKLGIVRERALPASFPMHALFPVEEPKNFEQWVSNQFGKRLFNIFFKTYTEKVWGMSCKEISADWAAQRIKGLSLGAAIVDASPFARQKQPKSGRIVKTLIELPLSAPRPRHDVGGLRPQDQGAGRRDRHGIASCVGCAYDRHDGLCGRRRERQRTRRALRGRARHLLGPHARIGRRALKPVPLTRLHARELKYRDFLTVVLIGKTRKRSAR